VLPRLHAQWIPLHGKSLQERFPEAISSALTRARSMGMVDFRASVFGLGQPLGALEVRSEGTSTEAIP